MSLMTNLYNFAPFLLKINIARQLIGTVLVKWLHFLECASNLMLNTNFTNIPIRSPEIPKRLLDEIDATQYHETIWFYTSDKSIYGTFFSKFLIIPIGETTKVVLEA